MENKPKKIQSSDNSAGDNQNLKVENDSKNKIIVGRINQNLLRKKKLKWKTHYY